MGVQVSWSDIFAFKVGVVGDGANLTAGYGELAKTFETSSYIDLL